jgi:catechol 2,3-dioxygenase-like lactoylglutathione lyase family enzyme
MANLYEASAWTLDEVAHGREYVFHAGGELLAKASAIPTRRQEDVGMPYANPHAQFDDSRTVLSVTGPDGTPYFFVDRSYGQMGPQPAFIVAPNGTQIGALVVQKPSLKGAFKLARGSADHQSRFSLIDAGGAPHVTLTAPQWRQGDADFVFTDQNGNEIARCHVRQQQTEGQIRGLYEMRIHQALPEPSRSLVLGSLLGLALAVPPHLRRL